MTAQPWVVCPSCGWNYAQHGDTHMSTRFNCKRARNTNIARSETAEHYAPTELNRYTGTINEYHADQQIEAVKRIMVDRKLDFDHAYNVYIDQEQTRKLRAEATARVKASGIFNTSGLAASHRPLFDKGDSFV